ncbi:MAG: hypothetical protein JWP92_1830 [Caulobacter sp.]|nr:hypothetical protein [Caulobacter sp.]
MTADEIVATLAGAAAQREAMIDALLAVAAATPVADDAVERLFDAAWYLQAYPDVAAAGIDPLAHFVSFPAERRNPNTLFDSQAWAEQRDLDPTANALADYVEGGAWKVETTRGFVAAHPDLAAAGVTPLEFALRS